MKARGISVRELHMGASTLSNVHFYLKLYAKHGKDNDFNTVG